MLQVQSKVPIDQPLFQPYPPEVVFHSYEPFKTYEATLRLRNNDTVRMQQQQQRPVQKWQSSPIVAVDTAAA
jgi:hypothetical protein